MSSTRFIALDEEGFFLNNGIRLQDANYGHKLISHLRVENRLFVTQDENGPIKVECFDQPLVARHLEPTKTTTGWQLILPYEYKTEFNLNELCLDNWDRFHGRDIHGVPFVFSRAAQAEFFNLLEEFDDESITWAGEKIVLPTLDQRDVAKSEVNQPAFWENHYTQWQTDGQTPGWELNEVAPALKLVLPQLKLPRSRWVAFGSGAGHDVAHLAQSGHIATGVDLSPSAKTLAQKNYGHIKDTHWVTADAFSFAEASTQKAGHFDSVFEHTFFCAVDPHQRRDVVNLWKKVLAPRGHLLAIFYLLDRAGGPPFGTSEWEVRELLKKDFDFLYWMRWHHSPAKRQGAELIVYAQKKSGLN